VTIGGKDSCEDFVKPSPAALMTIERSESACIDSEAHHGQPLMSSATREKGAFGVDDLIVAANGNDVLILPHGRSEKVKKVDRVTKNKQPVA
jgi:hypothetical protein